MEEIRKIATIVADDNEFLQFIITPLINSKEYSYSIDRNKGHKYIVNIYEKCNESNTLTIDDCLDKKEVDLTGKNNFFCMCNKCFIRFDSLEDLENKCIETVEDDKNNTSTTDATEIYLDRVFICYKCKAQIKIRKINPF